MRDLGGELLDVCLCTISRAPHSYTGEDTAELQCHGSPAVLRAGLQALFAAGARQALAGEFTKRAFLNGRMDLTQAEAVIDLIHAETTRDAKNAAGQLGGAVLRRENRRLLRDGGLVIFLDRSPWAIRRTLRRQGRPLLTDDGAIFRLARQRRDLYRATAHHSVNKPTAHQAAEEAVRLWREEQT